MNLNGTWKLYYAPVGSTAVADVLALKESGIPSVPCTVPGNVELDLSAAGLLPEDLYKGENILQAEQYETYEWWYETSFTAPSAPAVDHNMILRFGAVDCYADYYLNGQKIGESDNMFISQEFDVTALLQYGAENTLHVHIDSPVVRGAKYPMEPNLCAYTWHQPLTNLYTRKASHSYGWDIMPRAVSAGIWRDVTLSEVPKYGFRYVYFYMLPNGAVRMCYDTDLKPQHQMAPLTYVIKGTCGEHSFEKRYERRIGGSGFIELYIDGLKRWWPRHYGEPNMYDVEIAVYDEAGRLLCEKKMRQGFRQAYLRHSEVVEPGGSFEFVVNGVKIMAVGANWVPMDAYHSRDKARYQKALELALDANCNILRCWGGNVYEDHEFFDFCDDHGIMVWQDFGMGCHYYPQNETFFDIIRKEAEWVVAELRHHASLVLWCGDNEIDSMVAGKGVNPDKNLITREVLPQVVERLDPFRSYIASSPYISGKAFAAGDNQQGSKFYPEDHLWGPRDYFKSEFYKGSGAYFVSETGYHGCPAKASIEKFIDPEYVWPYFDNKQWNLHSSDQSNSPNRTMLMHKQVKQLFGTVPTEMEDYILASQISQAEAKKFFIERTRAKMNYMGGVIWWNLIDGWPQMSDAVVDYYYEKKLAFDFIARSSRDFIVMVDEMQAWGQDLLCANSTLTEQKGCVTVTDLDSGEVVFEKAFTAAPNANTRLGRIPLMYSDQGMFLIQWKLEDGTEAFNTYLYGSPAFDLAQYKGWLEKINKL